MNKYLKTLLYIFIPILILNILFSVLYYFNLLNDKFFTILKLLTVFISILIGGLYIGKKANKNGYLEGLKIGLIIIAIFFTISFILDKNINIKRIIYYLILLSTSTIGSILGINKKKNS